MIDSGCTSPFTDHDGTYTMIGSGLTDPMTDRGGAGPMKYNDDTDPMANSGGAGPVKDSDGRGVIDEENGDQQNNARISTSFGVIFSGPRKEVKFLFVTKDT